MQGDVQPMAWGELRAAPGGDARKGLEAGRPATLDFLLEGERMGVQPRAGQPLRPRPLAPPTSLGVDGARGRGRISGQL